MICGKYSSSLSHTLLKRGNRMELSSIVGKQILSPAGESLGYAKSVYLSRDFTKISSLCCIDEEEEEFYLPLRAILAVNDALIAGNARLSSPTGVPSPVGKSVYSHLGEHIGTVCDIIPSDYTVLMIFNGTEQSPYPAELTAIGESVIVYPDEQTKKALSPKKRRAPAKHETEKKHSLPAAPVETSQSENPLSAEPSYCRFGILGKQVKKSVYDSQGFPIVNAGEKVTAETVLRARKNNRLLQLTVNTLTNVY